MLRGIRFAARLGFTIEPATLEAIADLAPQIHTVSGATYTSTGYRQSLQAALDQAGHP